MIGVFGEAAGLLSDRHKDLAVMIPTVPHLRDLVRARTENWRITPIIIENGAHCGGRGDDAGIRVREGDGEIFVKLDGAAVCDKAAKKNPKIR